MKDKLENQITIGTTKDGQAAIYITPNLDAATAFQLVGTLALHVLNSYYKVAHSALEENFNSGATSKNSKLNTNNEFNAATIGIKESMYDAMDSIFSSVLTQFYPNAPRSDIEEEAILELVNAKIEERYNNLSDAEKAAFKGTYSQILDKLKQDSENLTTNDND